MKQKKLQRFLLGKFVYVVRIPIKGGYASDFATVADFALAYKSVELSNRQPQQVRRFLLGVAVFLARIHQFEASFDRRIAYPLLVHLEPEGQELDGVAHKDLEVAFVSHFLDVLVCQYPCCLFYCYGIYCNTN